MQAEGPPGGRAPLEDQGYSEDEVDDGIEGDEEQKEFEIRKTLIEKTEFQGSDDEAYQESEGGDEDEEHLRDDFSLSDEDDYEVLDDNEEGQDEERRNREFFGDDEYTLLSKVPEGEESQIMGMTLKEREVKDKQAAVSRLTKEIAQLDNKIKLKKELGEHIAGQTVIFSQLIELYQKLATNVDNISEEKQQEIYDEFISPIEADMSKAEILPICNTLNNLLISKNCKTEELAQAEAELRILGIE